MVLVLSQKIGSLEISINDLFLCFLFSGVMSGFISFCFVFSTRHLIAVDVILFFFIEIALIPFWFWLFLNEKTINHTVI